MRRLATFALCGWALAAPATGPVLDASTPAGLTFRHVNSPTPAKHLIEAMGGGVALLDYDRDGRLDIFLVNSGQLTAKMPQALFARSQPKHWNRLYRQNAGGTFTDVTQAAGLASAGDGNYGMGAAVADFDNDGFPDLYVTSFGRNILYRNTGRGTFVDVTAQAKVGTEGWSASAGFVDYDNDGWLDLFVTRYMAWTLATSRACGEAVPVYCPPATFPAVANVLYRNRGDGTFEDVSATTRLAEHKGRALGVAFADYDDDGFTDVFVANDGIEQFLFHNEGGRHFTERAVEAGAALSGDGQPVSGMGVDFRDYDNDGRPDVVVTALSRQRYAVFHNEGQGLFQYQSLECGLGALSHIHSGWGAGWADFDHDGWKDFFAAQGHVMDNVETIDPSLASKEPPLLAVNRRGRFDATPAKNWTPVAGRGLALGDLDNDGAVDAVMSVLGGAPIVYRNRGAAGHWLLLTLRGTRSNRDGLGARVRVNGQRQEAGTAGSYLSAHDRRVHFGLGTATTAEIEIRWPSGRRQTLTSPVDRIVEITEPSS